MKDKKPLKERAGFTLFGLLLYIGGIMIRIISPVILLFSKKK